MELQKNKDAFTQIISLYFVLSLPTIFRDLNQIENAAEIKPPLKHTLIWLQIFLEDADKANSTGWVISKIVWNKEAATINRIIDIAPNLLVQYS